LPPASASPQHFLKSSDRRIGLVGERNNGSDAVAAGLAGAAVG
jgi:hypothetical protein